MAKRSSTAKQPSTTKPAAATDTAARKRIGKVERLLVRTIRLVEILGRNAGSEVSSEIAAVKAEAEAALPKGAFDR